LMTSLLSRSTMQVNSASLESLVMLGFFGWCLCSRLPLSEKKEF
jgi:hypothetical protein